MASLATHFSGFLLLFPIGVRRLLSSSSLYLQNPSHFRSKLWYFSDPRWKNIDLYVLLIALPIASFSELLFFLSFSGHPTYRFSFFQQSFAVLAFWVLIILIIVHEGISGLAGVVYGLLGGLTLVCAASCIYLSVKPAAFFAEFLLSSGLVFKATWLLQAGFSLYTDDFGFKGCQKISLLSPLKESVDVHCELDENSLRGVTLMNFLFTVHAILVLVLAVGLFGLLASNLNLRCGEPKGPLLAELESTSMQMGALPELEME
ncbi:uncharacterized protein LOC133304784 [Gastrolobium bilobum]|uniref:uncharacterized protein LOC133304784 n=1 Tax=Gastrolobium bilobum TaxID=150636 RepID=UPI002AB1971B|nr:uncharacterized protein LOC133304784 [Gastrolobium bilobum]